MLSKSEPLGDAASPQTVPEYFDELYAGAADSRYWWRHPSPYSTNPDDYPFSLLTQLTLRLIPGGHGRRAVDSGRRAADQQPRALDLGAGEGADAIRLSRLGYNVTAVEISKVAAERIQVFAERAGESLHIQVGDVRDYQPDGEFDLILCNGVLHYVADKAPVIEMMQAATSPGGLNVISLWSDHTPVPECHQRVPVFCDKEEDSQVAILYRNWVLELLYFEPDRPESAHTDMPEHSHSHIKMIARKPG
jgi:SAM-dependent methyltransferase